ncbi:serine hydrolase [Nisaea nitritireducens]|uniref:serine hydrolase n=1 Tax=Nisaea nitritireducens TaxID=568392 RepID=UPI0018679F6A|nr:serine hydrolase [Nisaea nitritireducens]
MTPDATLRALFEAEKLDDARFSPAFLAQVPASKIAQILSQLQQSYGALQGITPDGDGYRLRFEGADIPARIALDQEGCIAGLWFGAPVPSGSIEEHAAAITGLPGAVSLLVLEDGRPLISHNADAALAVGSAAKLAILKALSLAVRNGEKQWSDVVELRPEWKSLPSGTLQDWPDGTPLTLGSLAHVMISISDNTATDALIRLVGREAVEAVSPRNSPFLTTRELFTLKTREHAALRLEWAGADEAARRLILERIANMPLPSAQALAPEPTYKAAEWFFSAQELCTLLEETSDLPSGSINPGPVDPGQWQHFSYKGGSETGVLNLSSRVVGADGIARCVVATWNHPSALDENSLLLPYRGILTALAGRSQ